MMPTPQKALLTSVTTRDPKGQRAVAQFEAAFNKARLDPAAAQRFNSSKGLAADFATLLRKHAAKQPDYTLARSILGGDFITAEEIMAKRPDIIYSPAMIAMLADTIPSAETLGALKARGLGLMPHPPEKIAMLAIRAAKPEYFYSKAGGWYEKVPFATSDLTGSGWFAHKLTPVEGSLNRNWDEQNQLLPATDYVPNAAETSWFITIFFDVRGVRLFENVYVRTSSLDSGGDRVNVGYFDAKGLYVSNYWDGYRDSILGLSSARKF